MAITKPRNRVVLFRLTEDEYQHLQQACEAGQARSISDYARARILGPDHVDGAQKPSILDADSAPSIQQVQDQLDQLHTAVETLTAMVAGTMPQPRKVAASVGASTALRGSEHA